MSLKYKLNAYVVTPVHVGAGQEKKLIKNLDFIIEGRKLVIIDTAGIFKALSDDYRARFLNDLSKRALKEIQSYFSGRSNFNIDSFKVAEIKCRAQELDNEVLPLISSAGPAGRTVYLPGSSIKGAIRSVLLSFLYGDKTGVHNPDETKIFGHISNNLMSYLQVSDARFNDNNISEIINTKIFNLHHTANSWKAGWKHNRHRTDAYFSPKGFTTSYEVFPTGSEASFILKINKQRLNFVKKNITGRQQENNLPPNYQWLYDLNIEELFKIINEHSKTFLEAEKDFFEKFRNEMSYCDKILEIIDVLLRIILESENKRCLLHMGCGTGFHGITGDWRFRGNHISPVFNKDHGKHYKSRKMSYRKSTKNEYEFLPMGFIMLSKSN